MSILQEGFRPSRNEYDWLGDGSYFFQDAPRRAWSWAKTRHGEAAAVVRAEIRLEDCIDLLDIHWSEFLPTVYNDFLSRLKRANLPMPRQTRGAHRLDREVLNYAIGVLQAEGTVVRSVRAAFSEGSPVFPGSALYDNAHVQLAVRDTAVIERTWILDRQDVLTDA